MRKLHFLKKNLLFIVLPLLLITSIFFYNSKIINTFNKSTYSNNMLVHYIDVGQGDCILIQVNNKNLLIDAGPKSNRNKLLKYLDSLNLKQLDYVIATHPHDDHIGNMATIINSYNVLSFYAPKVQTTTKSFEEMIDALKNNKLKINVIKKGIDTIDLGINTKVSVFSPTKDAYNNLNNYSPILKIQYQDTSFLFTGDAEKEIEDIVLANNENLNCDVIKIGHHGSLTSTSHNFLKKVNPSLAIISVGKNNLYNHPNKQILDLLLKYKINTYRTDIHKNIIISSDGTSIKKQNF